MGNTFDDDDDEAPVGDAGEHALSINAISGDFGELGADLSPWAPLLGMLDSTEPEASPGDRSFTPTEGVEGAHALELRAESMLQYSERTGELDRTEVGVSDDNRDVVAGRDQVEIDGMLDEHTGHGLVHVADEVELNVGGPLRMHAHLEDNIIMAGVMTDEWKGGTFITAAMSDDMAAGLGLRCTAPLDLWVHGLVGMEERPGTCAAAGVLFELAGTLYEREYGPSAHAALVARHSGTVVTTMKTGFRPLMKTAIGVRNLIPGGGEAAGAVTLTAAESGGALGRGVAGSDDTDEIVSVVRTVESASETAEVENLQHPAGTADNLDDLARVEAEGKGYQQVAEIYEQPIPAAAASEPDAAPVPGRGPAAADRTPPLDLTEPGTEGYDFWKSYGSLHNRNQFYREEFNFRGNLFLREYLREIDTKAMKLFQGLDGLADAIDGDNFGYRASSIYRTLEQMAEDAETANDLNRAADIRAAMDEIEGIVNSTLTEVAVRTDEFSGAAPGSPRSHIDPNIDTEKLRSWLQDQAQQAHDRFLVAETDEAGQLATWEWGYYVQLIKSLDEGVNPLAVSNEQIVVMQINTGKPNRTQFADEVAAAAAQGHELASPRPQVGDEADLYVRLQELLVATLSDPQFHRSAEEMGADAFTFPVRGRIESRLDFLGPDSGAPEPSLASRRVPPDSAQAPIIDERSGRWVVEPPAEPSGSPAPSDDAFSRTTDVSWESGLQVSDDSEFDAGDADPTGTLSGPDDSSTASRRGNGPGPDPSGTPSRITPGTPDPVSTGTAPGAPVADATPVGASASDAVAGVAGTRSDLYNEPVSFEGRSLEGTPVSDDSKELAQSLDGAEIPVEDLPPVEPGPAGSRRKSILKHADDMPDPGLSYVDEDEAITDRRIEYARNTRGRSNRNADTVWRRARNRKEAVDAANARWSEFAAAKRTSSTSFSDDPRQVLYLVEHETTLYSNTGEKIADVYRGVDPPNTLDRSHAAHFIPRPRGWEPAHETGFGRLSQGWNEFPFSHRERILNTLSKGESLNPEQIAALESGLEGYRAAGGSLSSSQHRAMVDMISDLSDQYRHARWSMEGERGKRLVQLIEMLDYAAMVV